MSVEILDAPTEYLRLVWIRCMNNFLCRLRVAGKQGFSVGKILLCIAKVDA